MGNNELEESEEEIFKYHDTEFYKKASDLIEYISSTFKNYAFTEKYLEYEKGDISKEEVNKYIKQVLLNLDEYTRHDLNHMWAMLSDKNCWCGDYRIGELVHKQLIEIWYPEDCK